MAYASGRGVPPAEIIGHRGSPRDFRENTLRSFAQAFRDGADGIELDVHGTRDGAIVVHHDAATNSRQGDSGPIAVIADSTLAALRQMEALGLVTRQKVAGNQRQVRVFLTPKGGSLRAAIVGAAEEVNRIALQGLARDDIAAARRVLLGIVDNLQREPE